MPDHVDNPCMAWDRLCELVTELERELADEVRDQEGLSLSQAKVMLALGASLHRGRRAVDIAQQVNISPSATTRIIQRLERRALVRRAPDHEDARARRISLTVAGRQTAARTRLLFETHAGRQAISSLPPAQVRALERLVTQLAGLRVPGPAEPAAIDRSSASSDAASSSQRALSHHRIHLQQNRGSHV